jgi:hypothetical protein
MRVFNLQVGSQAMSFVPDEPLPPRPEQARPKVDLENVRRQVERIQEKLRQEREAKNR